MNCNLPVERWVVRLIEVEDVGSGDCINALGGRVDYDVIWNQQAHVKVEATTGCIDDIADLSWHKRDLWLEG